MGSVPNCRQQIPMHDAIRWFKCKLKPPKKHASLMFPLDPPMSEGWKPSLPMRTSYAVVDLVGTKDVRPLWAKNSQIIGWRQPQELAPPSGNPGSATAMDNLNFTFGKHGLLHTPTVPPPQKFTLAITKCPPILNDKTVPYLSVNYCNVLFSDFYCNSQRTLDSHFSTYKFPDIYKHFRRFSFGKLRKLHFDFTKLPNFRS